MVRTLSPERRANLLSSALKLFVANGVTNTSTAEIAKEAGTAAGTLFLYFPTKQDLLNELVLKIGKEQSDHINNLLEPSLSARETFFTIWHGTVTLVSGKYGCLSIYPASQRFRDDIGGCRAGVWINSSATTTMRSKKG